jgi:hypothetical protein
MTACRKTGDGASSSWQVWRPSTRWSTDAPFPSWHSSRSLWPVAWLVLWRGRVRTLRRDLPRSATCSSRGFSGARGFSAKSLRFLCSRHYQRVFVAVPSRGIVGRSKAICAPTPNNRVRTTLAQRDPGGTLNYFVRGEFSLEVRLSAVGRVLTAQVGSNGMGNEPRGLRYDKSIDRSHLASLASHTVRE